MFLCLCNHYVKPGPFSKVWSISPPNFGRVRSGEDDALGVATCKSTEHRHIRPCMIVCINHGSRDTEIGLQRIYLGGTLTDQRGGEPDSSIPLTSLTHFVFPGSDP